MNNFELTNVLEVAVFGLAVAQALTILLTIGRERDVRELRALIEEQRLRLIELRAWIAGRDASRKQLASEPETSAEPITRAKAGMPAPKDDKPRGASEQEDAAARLGHALEWQRDVAARLRAGIQSPPTLQAAPSADKTQSGLSEGTFKWFKEDPNEPREIVEAREIVANSGGSPETSPQSSSTRDQLERVTEVVNRLKEDVTRSPAVTRPNGKPPAEMK
jgi:hypothetical protein